MHYLLSSRVLFPRVHRSWSARLAFLLATLGGCGGDGSASSDASTLADGSTSQADAQGDAWTTPDGNRSVEDAEAPSSTDDGGVPSGGALEFPPYPKLHIATIGFEDVCAIADDRTVQCTSRATTPSRSKNHDFERIRAAGYDLCGVRTDGSVACSVTEWTVPEGGGFVDVHDVSNLQVCAVRGDNGEVSCIEHVTDESFMLAGSYRQIVRVVTGDSGGVCGVLRDGSVRCELEGEVLTPDFEGEVVHVESFAGDGLCGVLRDGTIRCLRRAGESWLDAIDPIGNAGYAFDVFKESLCYLDNSRHAVCVDIAPSSRPRLQPPTDIEFVDISVSLVTACGISVDGDVWCWDDQSSFMPHEAPYKIDFPKPALAE